MNNPDPRTPVRNRLIELRDSICGKRKDYVVLLAGDQYGTILDEKELIGDFEYDHIHRHPFAYGHECGMEVWTGRLLNLPDMVLMKRDEALKALRERDIPR